jgi:uncharacterized protein
MYKKDQNLIFSPSDLTLHMESPFASWMERFSVECPNRVPAKDDADAMMGLLQDKGGEHEHKVLLELEKEGLSIANIEGSTDKVAATLEAMRSGADIIFQAALAKGSFKGHADFLRKVAGKSLLGDYHYEVWDTKLSKSLKPYFVIQLCCYAEMLEQAQGRRPENITVVLGNREHERLRTNDYYYYYQSLKQAFLTDQNGFDAGVQPDPADSKSWGSWSKYAEQLLQEADHLSQVATITRSQIKKLNRASIGTMQQLVDSRLERVPNISPPIFQRLKAQAGIQKASAGRELPLFEIVHHEAGIKQGLALLPSHSDQDVFFDIEGYPLDEGGLEYLWGNTYFDEAGDRQFKDFWAHNSEQEKQCFADFIHWVYERWQRDPNMHIFHYANYEIAACRKLMGRYGVCEYEVDQLLRNEVFVDLYKVIKGCLLLGEPRYSIKNVEHLYRGKRETEVGNGADSVVVYENWRELNTQGKEGDTWYTSKILNDIRDYNIDDCNSTQELVDWLRGQQQVHDIDYIGKVKVEEPDVPEEITERTKLRDQLLAKAEALQSSDPKHASLTENLAWSLEFHRREAKPVFWKLFDRLGLSHEELVDDLDCLAYCERTEREAFKIKRSWGFEYSFDPDQEFKGNSSKFYVLGEEDANGKQVRASIDKDESDMAEGLVVFKSTKDELPDLMSLVPDEYVSPDPIPAAINNQVLAFSEGKLKQSAIVDFLERNAPRIKDHTAGEAIVTSSDDKERLQQIIKAAIGLDNSCLTIQGPPGAGKTYTATRIIAELVKQGRTVGICSNSHKAINNLLIGAATHCHENGITATFACTQDNYPKLTELGITILKGNTKLAEQVEPSCVLGTTAWGFSRDDMAGQLDYLFIDEAGQVSVANLIAISRSAKNLILMGDQMQLGQPSQGIHPAESGLSTLDYLLHDSPTIADHMGVFLGTTYRMHSAVNRFISDAIYNGKLNSDLGNDNQIIAVPANYQGPLNKEAGLVFIPVEHEGNTQASDEEVAEIQLLVNDLLGRIFTKKDGSQLAISWADMLFVTPYNHQVNKLKHALATMPGGVDAKVGSVDKFQGQEAPVVFLSMCASDAAESPRGLEFLFDKHRINVAISRAQSLAIVVAEPSLVEGKANRVDQMSQINLFARLVSSAD